MMDKFYLRNSFLLGLYLFLRQVQLSIDRSFYDDWNLMCNFLEKKTTFSEVLHRLNSISKVNLDLTIDKDLRKPILSHGLLARIFGRRNYLIEDELIYIYNRLHFFCTLQKNRNVPARDILIALRCDIQFAEVLVKTRVQKKTLVGKEFVEHFNQNELLHCRSIDELVGEHWIDQFK